MTNRFQKSAHQAPKGDKRLRTKALLIRAAAEVIQKSGFERTTLADIAAQAGVTTGAIYGNFKNKEELFMAVAEAVPPIAPAVTPGMTWAEAMGALARAVIESLPLRRKTAVGVLGFHAYTLTHEEFQARVAAKTQQIYAQMLARTHAAHRDEQLPAPPEVLVPVVHVLVQGLMLQRFLTPELITDQVIYGAFDLLAGKRKPAS